MTTDLEKYGFVSDNPAALTKEQFEKILDSATAAGKQAVVGMIDSYPCGGAYLEASGNDWIVKLFKKFATKDPERQGHYNTKDWTMWKASRGFVISNRANGGYQNMDMHSAENNAYVRVFGMNNIPVRVHTYID